MPERSTKTADRMDKDTYYVFAIVLSSVSSLASAVNLSLLLRDRSFRPKCMPCFVSRIGSNEVFLDPTTAVDAGRRGQGRAAIVIYNDSTAPCTVQSVTIRPFLKHRLKYIFGLGESSPIEGQFSPAQFPQGIKGREAAVFSFNPDYISTHKFGQIQVNFVGRKSKKLNIAKSYYRLSMFSRIIERVVEGSK